MIDLLELLEDSFPVKREIKIDGWPDGFYLWKLEAPDLLEMTKVPHANAEDMIEYSLRLIQLGVGDVNGPGTFDNERGTRWLLKNAVTMTELAKAVREFNELSGPSEERKKKSETNESSDCSTLVENLDSDIQSI